MTPSSTNRTTLGAVLLCAGCFSPTNRQASGDSEERDSALANSPPSAAAIVVTPSSPTDGDALTCSIVTDAVDPDGDAVTYAFSWSVDGTDAGLTVATVAASLTSAAQTWTCTVTPTDGTLAGPPATASVTIEAGTVEFIDYTTGFGSAMLTIPGGTFSMGSSSYGPIHTVTLTHDFWMARTEVTQAEWAAWTTVPATPGSAPSFHEDCPDCPVEGIAWADVAMYANALSAADGLDLCYTADGTELVTSLADDPYDCPGYRLPTEAEWEYAARAGDSYSYSGSNDVDDVAWTSANSAGDTHDVAELAANGWGLYDMSGNVFEWTHDWTGYVPNSPTDSYASGPATDPVGADSGTNRIVRGGWYGDSTYTGVAERTSADHGLRYYTLGFRLVRSYVDPSETNYSTAWGSEMVAIPRGAFTMGAGEGDPNSAYTDHEVTLTHALWLGKSELTQAQWAAWTSAPDPTPSWFSTCDNCPVEQVSWEVGAMYLNALSAAEGLSPCYLADGSDIGPAYVADPYSCEGYRLPTEAEWEYAARAGDNTTYSGSNTVEDVAWCAGTSSGQTQAVCTLDPNSWGLCDMSGNVWEWTNDWYSSTYGGYGSGSPSTDPPGPSGGSDRSLRGGGWDSADTSVAWLATRDSVYPTYTSNGVGLRIARTIP